jgi:uncharacterized protein YeaO (DUF488 family)
MIGLESSLKEIARSTKLQECLGHVPDNFHKQHRAELKMTAIRVYRLQSGNEEGYRHIALSCFVSGRRHEVRGSE